MHLFIDALYSKNFSSHIPVWFMRQAGRYQPSYQALRQKYSFDELCLTPELACRITIQAVEEMNFDAAILFSDILFPLRAFGLDVSFSPQSIPVVRVQEGEDTIYARAQAVCRNPISADRLFSCCAPVYEAARLIRSSLKVPLLGFSAAPWTLLTYILEGKTSPAHIISRSFMLSETQQASVLLQEIEQLIILHLNAQIDAGCDAVQLFDSWSAELSPGDFLRYARDPLQRIIRALHLKPDGSPCPLIYYAKGTASRYKVLSGIGLHALSCDTGIALQDITPWALQEKIALQGNLDPALLCLDREHPVLHARLSEMLTAMADMPHYICNLGHGVPKEANYDTVQYVVDTVRNWKN